MSIVTIVLALVLLMAAALSLCWTAAMAVVLADRTEREALGRTGRAVGALAVVCGSLWTLLLAFGGSWMLGGLS